MVTSTTYFWQIVAHNAAGATQGPQWSFTTMSAPPPPGVPASPSPAMNATSVSPSVTVTWTAAGATSYDVQFGMSNPPPVVATGISSASATPPTLADGTTYFWQVVSHNGAGATTGAVWSFTTGSNGNIVIYASDIPASAAHGDWSMASDATSPNGTKWVTPASGASNASAPLGSPNGLRGCDLHGQRGHSLYAMASPRSIQQFQMERLGLGSVFGCASQRHGPSTRSPRSSALLVNMATDSTAASDVNWGWINGCYWLSQPATVTFATSGVHTIRIQVREAGVMFDQIVLSPSTYLTAAPGGRTNDATIVPKS